MALIGFAACNSKFNPKTTGYPLMPLPQKAYQSNAVNDLPYAFDIPTYAVVDKKVEKEFILK